MKMDVLSDKLKEMPDVYLVEYAPSVLRNMPWINAHPMVRLGNAIYD